MTAEPAFLTFDTCADAEACRAGIRPLLAPGMDWSEVHCGRCGRQGIVRHADLSPANPEPVPAPAEAPQPTEPAEIETASDSVPEPAASPQAAPKGGRS